MATLSAELGSWKDFCRLEDAAFSEFMGDARGKLDEFGIDLPDH